MADISTPSEFADVMEDGYVTGPMTITTTAQEAKAGSSALTGRESISIENMGNETVYYGPLGVTVASGQPLYKKQWISLPLGATVKIYLLTAQNTSNVRVQEFA